MKPPNTPAQKAKLKPKEIFKALEARKFNLFRRADIVLTNNHTSLLAKIIRLKDKGSVVNHAELYGFTGHAIAANNDGININSLNRFFKGNHDVYVFRCKKLSILEASDIFYRACRWLRSPYDWWGIVCQGLDFVSRSTWFSRKFNGSLLPYCSELVQRAYGHIRVSRKPIGVATPYNIYSYLDDSKNWKSVFSMVKVGKDWIYEMEKKNG